MGEKYLGEKSVGEKSFGENRGRWDAGFRFPPSQVVSFAYATCLPCVGTLWVPDMGRHELVEAAGTKISRDL